MTETITRRTRALKFHRTSLHIVRHGGDVWLRAPQIGGALGYRDAASRISKLYQQHAAEFTDRMTQLVTLQTAGGPQEVRVFSLRGAHLLAMFARTERAAEFRKWVLDVLEGTPAAAGHTVVATPAGPPPARALPPPGAMANWPATVERFPMPPELRAAIQQHAVALSLAAHHELSAYLTERIIGGCLGGLGEWAPLARAQEKLSRIGLADWQAEYHAKRVRGLQLLVDSVKQITAEWADQVRAESTRLEPELSANRETIRNPVGAAINSVVEFGFELPHVQKPWDKKPPPNAA